MRTKSPLFVAKCQKRVVIILKWGNDDQEMQFYENRYYRASAMHSILATLVNVHDHYCMSQTSLCWGVAKRNCWISSHSGESLISQSGNDLACINSP